MTTTTPTRQKPRSKSTRQSSNGDVVACDCQGKKADPGSEKRKKEKGKRKKEKGKRGVVEFEKEIEIILSFVLFIYKKKKNE